MKTLYLILGMHRSGTSLTVQLLKSMNVWVGSKEQMLLKDEYNERGYWELRDLVQMNDLLITKCNKVWYSLESPIFDKKLASQLIPNFVQKYLNNDKNNIAIKDPRLSNIWKQWISFMNYNDRVIRGVVVVRNPFEVADSLLKRDCIQKQYALCLWYQYNWQCLLFSREYETIWLDYSDYFNDFSNVNVKLTKFVYGTKYNEKVDLSSVVDEGIRHFCCETNELDKFWLTEKVQKMYGLLQGVVKGEISVESIIGECKEDYAVVTQYGMKLIDTNIESMDAKRTHLQILGSNPSKYWLYSLKEWLVKHDKPIILCGNGKNLEKLLPLLESERAKVIGIYDNYNFEEKIYNGNVFNIWSMEELVKYREKDVQYLVTPYFKNEEEIYSQICKLVPCDHIYRLSDILLNFCRDGKL